MKPFELQRIIKQTAGSNPGLILQELNLTVQPGEFVCLTGPAGSGKSTLLRIMAGLTAPTSGHVVNRPQRLGFVFQDFGLMPWLTVNGNIAYGLHQAAEHPQAIRRVVSEQVDALSLRGLEHHHPAQLTDSQKQRVGLARALAVNPDLLLLDDPFIALDAATAEELRAYLLQMWHDTSKTIVMVTRQPEEAARLASRILVLSPRPATIVRSITNPLPHPRQIRSPEFYKLVDTLTPLVRS